MMPVNGVITGDVDLMLLVLLMMLILCPSDVLLMLP